MVYLISDPSHSAINSPKTSGNNLRLNFHMHCHLNASVGRQCTRNVSVIRNKGKHVIRRISLCASNQLMPMFLPIADIRHNVLLWTILTCELSCSKCLLYVFAFVMFARKQVRMDISLLTNCSSFQRVWNRFL